MRRKRKGVDYSGEVVAPAVITPLHVQDVETSKVVGSPRAWRKLTVMQQAYRQGRLGPIKSECALARVDAANQYTDWWFSSQRASRDSTALLLAGRCGGKGEPASETVREAQARISAIENHLGRNDRAIVRSVCVMGHTIAEAMVVAGLPKETRVSPRLIEAMDALIDAIERTDRRNRR